MKIKKLSADAVKSIMQKRTHVSEACTGKRVILTVQGDGTVIDVVNAKGELVESISEPGTVLQKKLVRFKANSELAMRNPKNIQLFREGLVAERTGDLDKANCLYNDFLNKVQLSVGILLPSTIADKLTSRTDIAGRIQRIVTENGSLLTIEPDSISIQAPEVLSQTPFSTDSFTQEDEVEEESQEPTPIPVSETAKQRKAREAFDRGRGVEPLLVQAA